MRRVIGILVLLAAAGGAVTHVVRERAKVEAASADSPSAPRVAEADPGGVRGVPGLGPRLDALAGTPAAAAAAMFAVESRLFTRLDSASALDFACDEAMPEWGLFAAEARPLDERDDESYPSARVVVTSVGRARLAFEGCALSNASVEPGLRVDTVTLRLERHSGALRATGGSDATTEVMGTIAFAGPMRSMVDANWAALAAQADSVRAAHGQPPARALGRPDGHYTIRRDGWMRFPEQRTPCVAPLAASPATPGARPQLALSPDVAKGSEEIEGEWLSLATSATGVCVTPVRVTSTRAGMLGCGREPDHPGGGSTAGTAWPSDP
jgi:hypothetical protein